MFTTTGSGEQSKRKAVSATNRRTRARAGNIAYLVARRRAPSPPRRLLIQLPLFHILRFCFAVFGVVRQKARGHSTHFSCRSRDNFFLIYFVLNALAFL